jgi:MarR family transcriptional regulator, organic hydroperoxide resistance regulator
MMNGEREESGVCLAESQRLSLDKIERAILHISWLGQRQFMQLLEDHRFRLTLPQFYTLLHLHQVSGECKMSDLAEATHQSAAALTGVIDRLLAKQLVARTRHTRDRRQVIVLLTPRGSMIIDQIKQSRRKQMQAALSLLTEEEIEIFLRLLDCTLAGMLRVSDQQYQEHYQEQHQEQYQEQRRENNNGSNGQPS